MPDSTNTQGKRRPLVMGNWKMNGRQANNEALLSALKPAVAGFDTIDVAVCPPFPYLSQTASQLADSNITFGAQNLSAQQDGAYTGEVSSGMLVDLKVRWVLVGHSERRSLYGETDEIVAAKTQVALDAGLIPVVCVGETFEERKTGDTEVTRPRPSCWPMSLSGPSVPVLPPRPNRPRPCTHSCVTASPPAATQPHLPSASSTAVPSRRPTHPSSSRSRMSMAVWWAARRWLPMNSSASPRRPSTASELEPLDG